jgi:phosphotransferase system HPr-like phosphotransfer protein
MKSVTLKLSQAEEIKEFVNTVNRYSYEMDLRAGRHVVDAKSILGIFSLDLSKPISLEVYSDDCADLMEDIKRFMI